MLTEEQRMRSEISTFLDEDLIEEMTRRGMLRTMAITSEVANEAFGQSGFIEYAERRMATDIGLALAAHGALPVSREESRLGLALRMELTILLAPTSPVSTPGTS